jgi:hypothetical protein
VQRLVTMLVALFVSLSVMALLLAFLFIVEDLLAFLVVSINAFRFIIEIRMMLMEIMIVTGEQTGLLRRWWPVQIIRVTSGKPRSYF